MKERAEAGDLSPAEVIAWLRSRKGEQWSSRRVQARLQRQYADSGVFASVLPDVESLAVFKLARWPEPYSYWRLDDG